MIYPSLGIKIKGRNVAKWLYKIITLVKYPYNFVFYEGSAIIYPRAKIFPIEGIDWRTGATELSGVFVFKIKLLYETLTLKYLIKIMREISLSKDETDIFLKKIKQVVLKKDAFFN